jgi:Fe2+ or Zn2+ uptake regulation protein
MSMRTEILSALEQNGADPMTSQEIVDQVHRQSGTEWKVRSLRKALGKMVTEGLVRNLDRDPVTGNYGQFPCRYQAVIS